jgi:hypothetical protein
LVFKKNAYFSPKKWRKSQKVMIAHLMWSLVRFGSAAIGNYVLCIGFSAVAQTTQTYSHRSGFLAFKS